MKYRVKLIIEPLEGAKIVREAEREISMTGSPMSQPFGGNTHLSIDVDQQKRFLRMMVDECANEAIGR